MRILEERVRRHEPTHARCVIASTEIVEVRFGVAFFAGELVVLGNIWTVVRDNSAVRIVVDILLAATRGAGDHGV